MERKSAKERKAEQRQDNTWVRVLRAGARGVEYVDI